MNWEEARKEFLRHLRATGKAIEALTKKELSAIIKKIKKNPAVSIEMEKQLTLYAASIIAHVKAAIYKVAEIGAGSTMSDPIVRAIAKEVIEHVYPNGLDLSDSLWAWKNTLKKELRETLVSNIKLGESGRKLVYQFQSVIEKHHSEQFAHVLKEETPKWLNAYSKAARGAFKNVAGRAEFKRIERAVKRHVEKLALSGAKTAGRQILKQLKKTVETGNAKLLDKSLEWWAYDKQLYALKRIAEASQANSFHTAQIKTTEKNSGVIGYKWVLSSSHPKPDICNDYAAVDFGMGRGVWTKKNVPRQKPHPFCFCYLIPKAA